MPAEPSLSLLRKFIPPKNGDGPKRKPETLPPNILRDIFEGIVDTGMGAIGVGPDTTANRAGAVLGAALPFGLGGKLKQAGMGTTNKGTSIKQIAERQPVQMGPSAGEVERLIGQMQGNLKSLPPRGVYRENSNFLTGSRKPAVPTNKIAKPVISNSETERYNQKMMEMYGVDTSKNPPIQKLTGRSSTSAVPTNRGIAGPSNQKQLTRGDADFAYHWPAEDLGDGTTYGGFDMYNIPMDGQEGKTTVMAEAAKAAGYGIPYKKVGLKKPGGR